MVTESGNVAQGAINNGDNGGVKRISDNRRSNKPIMEKRRRARINNCLNQLKTLILDAMKKDPARHSKLEKADILEMTVKYLQNVQRAASPSAADATASKFRAGFAECASEVGRFPGLDAPVKRRLLKHLAASLGGQRAPAPSGDAERAQLVASPGAVIVHNGVQLVQTRLPNGDVALMFPNGAPVSVAHAGAMPLLVPIPTRTSSTASASSSSSHYSSSPESPEPMEVQMRRSVQFSPPMQKPLSLVMRKECDDEEPDQEDDEKVWRPW